MLSARELEFMLYEHPAVWDVAVIEEPAGQLAAFVQPRAGQKLDAAEITQFCRKKLGELRTPDRFYVVSKLPKTKTGKISHHDLLELIPQVNALSL